MPRFYFDLRDGSNLWPDEYGEACACLEEAREHAQVILTDSFKDIIPDGEERILVCEVRDERRELVYRGQLRYDGALTSGRSDAG